MTDPARSAREATSGQPGSRGRRGLPRVPRHVAVLLGVSAGTYGVFLAAATALEAGSETAAANERAPIADAVARMVAGHDALAAELDDARLRYGEASDAYNALVASISDYEARLTDLAARIDGIQREATSLPGSVAVSRPATVTTATGGTGFRQAATISQPAATPKPVATATTGASGTVKP